MTYKNRSLLKYWLPILYRNGVKVIKEGHDHSFTRTIPLQITSELPGNSRMEKISYEPTSWTLPDNLSDEYFDNGIEPIPIHRFRWDIGKKAWFNYDVNLEDWTIY